MGAIAARAFQISANTSGSIAILFGLMLLVLSSAIGLAVDYSRYESTRSWLQTALDSAVLAAVQEDTTADAKTKLQAYFDWEALEKKINAKPTAKVLTFDAINLTAEAKVELPMTFAKIFGQDDADIVVISAAAKGGGHQLLQFALDLSGSLGVGATPADRDALESLTAPYVSSFYGSSLPQGCAFGCHRREGWEPGTQTVYEMARDAGIKLREDELITQFSGLVDLLLDPSDKAVQSGMRKISVMAFSGTTKQLITESSSASSVKGVLNDFPKSDRYDTRYANAFTALANTLGDQGTGSVTSPIKTLVLITDGVESRDAFHSQSPMNTNLCDTIKNKGIRLAIVELKYPKLETNFIYDDTVLPVEEDISPKISECASEGWYFQAINNDDVPAKFEELKDQITNVTAHLVK